MTNLRDGWVEVQERMDTNTQQPKPTQIQPLTQDQSSSAAWKSDVQL